MVNYVKSWHTIRFCGNVPGLAISKGYSTNPVDLWLVECAPLQHGLSGVTSIVEREIKKHEKRERTKNGK